MEGTENARPRPANDHGFVPRYRTHADPEVAGLAASGRAVQRLVMDRALPASCATDNRAGLNRYDASPPAHPVGPDRRHHRHPRGRHPLPARQIDIHQRAVEQRIQTSPKEIADELRRWTPPWSYAAKADGKTRRCRSSPASPARSATAGASSVGRPLQRPAGTACGLRAVSVPGTGAEVSAPSATIRFPASTWTTRGTRVRASASSTCA